MRTIPRVLAAGVTNTYAVFGRYFRIMTNIDPVNVDLMRGGAVVYEAVNVQAGFYAMPEGGFDAIRINSATSQTIQVAVTSGNGGYDRSTGDVNLLPGGEVDVIDRAARLLGFIGAWAGKNRLYSPGFMRQSDLAASAAVNSVNQLWNPAGSGVRLYVDRVFPSVTANASISFALSVAALTTLVGTGFNKTNGGAASLGQVRNVQVAGPAGTLILQRDDVVPGAQYELNLEEPIILPEGTGLSVWSQTVNQRFLTTFEWREGA